MAATSNPEISATELELKRRGRRRLIGAVTIGLLAIVFLPMIFDSAPKRAGDITRKQDISIQVPPKEGQPPLPAPSAAPVVVAPSAASSTVAETAPTTVVPDSAKPIAATAAPVPRESPKEPAKAPAKSDRPAKAELAPHADKSGFVVQLGVFGDAENARQIMARMKEAKLSVYSESIPIKAGNATRVRIGPFVSREKADAALAQVKLAGSDGKIVALKP
jgi:DedD protein